MLKRTVADVWFGVQEYCQAGIIRVREHHVDPYLSGDMWFVQGQEKSLLIDTGTGTLPVKPVIDELSTGPVLAVALNCFYDHAGGLHEFSDRACHKYEADALTNLDAVNSLASDYVNDEMYSELPYPGFTASQYRVRSAPPTLLLEDGDVIDLGDRCLEVLHLPGRSAGGMALWEQETGIVFTSDMLFDDPANTYWPPVDLEAFIKSLELLRGLPVTRVYGGHFGCFDRERMVQLIDLHMATYANCQPARQ